MYSLYFKPEKENNDKKNVVVKYYFLNANNNIRKLNIIKSNALFGTVLCMVNKSRDDLAKKFICNDRLLINYRDKN